MMINLTSGVARWSLGHNTLIDLSRSTPLSDSICPLILWILISICFVTFAIAEYFVILALIKFSNQVSSSSVQQSYLKSSQVTPGEKPRNERLERWIHRLDRGSIMLVPMVYGLVVVIFIMWIKK
jgi:hypothetical protein